MLSRMTNRPRRLTWLSAAVACYVLTRQTPQAIAQNTNEPTCTQGIVDQGDLVAERYTVKVSDNMIATDHHDTLAQLRLNYSLPVHLMFTARSNFEATITSPEMAVTLRAARMSPV